jgi:hypothetical protein
LCLLAPLAGCALVEPHQHVAALAGVEAIPEVSLAGPLDGVLRDIRQQQRNYQAAVTAHSAAASAGPIVAAALAASSIALTGAGAGSEALRFGLGAGALGVVGTTTLLHNRARQEVYLAGVRALTCMIGTEAPFLVAARDLAQLDQALLALRQSAARLAEARQRHGANRTPAARWDNARLDELARRAEQAAQARAALPAPVESALNAAALRLRAKGMEVVSLVDQRLIEAGRDPATVLQPLLQGLGGMPAPLTGFAGLAPAPSDGSTTAGRPAFTGAQDAVDPAADELAARLPAVEALLASQGAVVNATPRGGRACLAALRPNQLLLLPDEPVVSVRALPTRLRFTLRGGTGDRQVALAGQFPAGSVSLAQSMDAAAGHVVELTLTAEAQGAAPRLVAADGSGAPPLEVEIRIAPAARESTPTPSQRSQGGGQGAGGPQARTADARGHVQLHREELAALRHVIGRAAATETGLVKADLDAIALWAKDRILFEGLLTQGVLDALLNARRDALRDQPPSAEEQVDIAQVRLLRCRVMDGEDMTPSGPAETHLRQLLDPPMRARIFARQLAAIREGYKGAITLSARLDGPTRTYLSRPLQPGEPRCQAVAG